MRLQNLTVVSFESRMAHEMARLVANFGGNVISAPSMQEIPFEKNQEALLFAEKLLEGKIDALICLTGVGTRALFEVMEKKTPRPEFVKALSRVTVVARGPKPVRVLKEYGVPIAITVPEPNTWREILAELEENEASIHFEGKTVALQEYGETNDDLVEGLRRRKANVVRVPVYRWALPDDTGPLKAGIRAVLDEKADVVLFTNKVQAEHVFRVASEEGLEEKLKKAFHHVVVASIGPICTEGLVSHGISVDFESERSKIGSFVLEVAEAAPAILKKKRESGIAARSTDVRHCEERSDEAISQKKPLCEIASPAYGGLAMTTDSPFMKALRREKAPYTPIWLMRQAGRYMKEYREIRRKVSFIDLCRDKDLVTQVTVEAQEFLGADAAIIFSDLLLILEGFGMQLEYAGDEGPSVGDSFENAKALSTLPKIDVRGTLGFVLGAIRQTRQALKPNIPLLGFAGAPFTLVSYMVEGGASKTFRHTKALMYREPRIWEHVMNRVADAVGEYLLLQIEAGCQAVQIFDSWVGCLGPEDYREFAAPYTRKALKVLEGKAPVIHFGTGTGTFLKEVGDAGGDAVGIDWRVRLDDAWRILGADKAIQGNLDPLVLLGDKGIIEKRVREILAQAGGRPGHIFNLGHGVHPETPPENAKYLVELVHELSRHSEAKPKNLKRL